MKLLVRNILRAICPEAPAELKADIDRLEDRAEILVLDPTPSTPITRLDIELMNVAIARRLKTR